MKLYAQQRTSFIFLFGYAPALKECVHGSDDSFRKPSANGSGQATSLAVIHLSDSRIGKSQAEVTWCRYTRMVALTMHIQLDVISTGTEWMEFSMYAAGISFPFDVFHKTVRCRSPHTFCLSEHPQETAAAAAFQGSVSSVGGRECVIPP